MFSLMNVLEIARDAVPSRAKEIRDFLEKLSAHWIPMTIDPLRVIDAEQKGRTPDGAHGCVSVAFISDPRFARLLTKGAVTLAHVVDLTRGRAGDLLRHDSDQDEANLLKNLGEWRAAHAANPKEVDTKYPFLKFDSAKPMRGIYYGLVRYAITDSFTLNERHARDLYHAIASVGCADLVTLDAHWAGQVRKLKLPADFVRVYSESEFDQFLADLEAAPATR